MSDFFRPKRRPDGKGPSFGAKKFDNKSNNFKPKHNEDEKKFKPKTPAPVAAPAVAPEEVKPKTHVFFNQKTNIEREEEEKKEMEKTKEPEASSAEVILSPAYLSTQVVVDRRKGFDSITVLKLNKKNIIKCEDFSYLPFLKHLELAHNKIKDLKFLQDNTDLTYLDISHNEIDSLYPLMKITKLHVFKASHNKIKTIQPDFLSKCKDLKALIIDHNEISSFPKSFEKLKELDTMVISHNNISDLTGVSKFNFLSKLSISFNSIRAIPATEIMELKRLKELRIAHNKVISIPDEITFAASLETLIINANFVNSIDDIKRLKGCTKLRALNFKDNPISKSELYATTIKELFPKLEVLDDVKQEYAKQFEKKRKRVDRKAFPPSTEGGTERKFDRKLDRTGEKFEKRPRDRQDGEQQDEKPAKRRRVAEGQEDSNPKGRREFNKRDGKRDENSAAKESTSKPARSEKPAEKKPENLKNKQEQPEKPAPEKKSEKPKETKKGKEPAKAAQSNGAEPAQETSSESKQKSQPEAVVERLVSKEEEAKQLQKIKRQQANMEPVNLLDEKEKKRVQQALHGGYAESGEQHSGVQTILMNKKLNKTPNKQDKKKQALDKLFFEEDDVGAGESSEW